MATLDVTTITLVAVALVALLVWRIGRRHSRDATARGLTVSRAWLVQHQSKEQS